MSSTEHSVAHVPAIGVPRAHLQDVLTADMAGEANVQEAAASTGTARNTALGQSILAAEDATKAWTKYKASAIGLPGESTLAGRYARDYVAGKAVAGAVLITIVGTNQPAPLPTQQVVAAAQDRQDLIALISLYDGAASSALAGIEHRVSRARQWVLLSGGILTLAILLAGGYAFRASRRVAALRKEHDDAVDLTDFEARLMRALDFTSEDRDTYQVAAKALSYVSAESQVAIATLDANQATLAEGLGATTCAVRDPTRCPAMRSGAAVQFADSTAIDACPVLMAADVPGCSVMCSPVSVAGRDELLVQLTGPVAAPPPFDARTQLVIRRLGERITMLRANARIRTQAAHDPLTGLPNRRSIEATVERLVTEKIPYTVAFADLDHFKDLNDVHGHDAGDQALRTLAGILTGHLRPDDLPCRWGGEEFVVVLPRCERQEAIGIMERLRSVLEVTSIIDVTTHATISIGVAEAWPDETFAQAVNRADEALRSAKAKGRNRVVGWEPEATSTPHDAIATQVIRSQPPDEHLPGADVASKPQAGDRFQ
ncbi:MAG TPA: GGDEF domain-containing protein [Acidimicrobiales bacterium]|nr:GGDEF domain-containing protein [Acidimicrobiales bacterium]